MSPHRWRSVVLIFVIAGSLLRAGAAEPVAVLNLWPARPPGEQIGDGPEIDTTKPGDRIVAGRRVVRIGNVATPQIHVFLPPATHRNGTAVLVCPGGGFNILAWDLEGTEVAAWLNSLGVAAVVLKYRVPTSKRDPYWLAPVQDAQRALSLVRSHATEWAIAPDRIGALGFSAGGFAAGHIAINTTERLYAPGDAVDRVSFRPDFAVLVYAGRLVDEKTLQLKPEFADARSAPPTFFVHAADDHVPWQNAAQLFFALRQAKVPSELHVYEKGGHGYGLRPQPEFPVTAWTQRCAEWLRGRGLLAAGAPGGKTGG